MDEWAEPDPTPAHTGPQPIPGDTWDAATGRHRAVPARSRPPWVLIGAALAVVVAGVAVALSLTGSGPEPGEPLAAVPTLPTELATVAATTALPSVTVPVVSVPVVTAPPSPSPPSAPAFGPLVLEAEDVPPPARRSVRQVDLGGGRRGVRFTDDRGRLEFRSLAVPSSATYRVTVVYAPHPQRSRTLLVDGFGPPRQVTLAAGTGCCRQVSVSVSLTPGGTLTVGPTNWEGSLPAIDRIEISQG